MSCASVYLSEYLNYDNTPTGSSTYYEFESSVSDDIIKSIAQTDSKVKRVFYGSLKQIGSTLVFSTGLVMDSLELLPQIVKSGLRSDLCYRCIGKKSPRASFEDKVLPFSKVLKYTVLSASYFASESIKTWSAVLGAERIRIELSKKTA